MCKHCCFCPFQALWAGQMSPKLLRLSEFPCPHHILPAQLPDQHHYPRPNIPNRTIPGLFWWSHLHRHHQGQRRGLLQHQEAEQFHRRCLSPETSPQAQRFPDRCGDEAAEAGNIHLIPCQDLCLYHFERDVKVWRQEQREGLEISYGAKIIVRISHSQALVRRASYNVAKDAIVCFFFVTKYVFVSADFLSL